MDSIMSQAEGSWLKVSYTANICYFATGSVVGILLSPRICTVTFCLWRAVLIDALMVWSYGLVNDLKTELVRYCDQLFGSVHLVALW